MKGFSKKLQASNVTGYINAGGRGTRLNTVFAPSPAFGISKALLRVGVPPISLIEHHINKLKNAGVSGVVAGVGDHLHVARYIEKVYGYMQHVCALAFDDQLGNGGDLVRAVRSYPHLFCEDILITNVDSLIDFDEGAVMELHWSRRANITIALTQNKGVPNENAYFVGENDEVLYSVEATVNATSEKRAHELATYYGSSTGIVVIKCGFLRDIGWSPNHGPLSLYRDVVAYALQQGAMYSYNNGERFFIDVGTVDAWDYVQRNPEVFQSYLRYR